mmetsp:Transcript_11015/g.16712  ORF Transcript_11015/g.16712 Transcript_11015/m.16712 type:complete len:141 (+) Transcript_11015:4154-4576(+)
MTEGMYFSQLMFTIIIAMLFVLSFFQFILSVQANLKESKWQIGVLRAIGLKKDSVSSLVLIESSAVILAATLIGFIVGYVITILSVSLFQVIAELPTDYSVDWVSLVSLTLLGLVTVWVGTKMSMHIINSKRITQILRGD